MSPDGKLRSTLLKSYANFLATSPMKRDSPPEWLFWGVNLLLGSKDIQNQKEWLDQIEDAGDATIALYTRLARLAADKPALPSR